MELAFCYASKDTDVTKFPSELFSKRFEERLGHVKDEFKWLDGEFLQTTACFVPKGLRQALSCVDRISTDAQPLSFDDYYIWDVDQE